MKTPPHLFHRRLLRLVATAAAVVMAGPSWAQVAVSQPWARATVTAQKSSGVFLELTAASASRLTGVSTPVAGVAEIHEMKMDGDVMRMRPVESLALPAGQTVSLKPGGYHVMLMDLKQQLKAGESFPLTLRVSDAAGQPQEIAVEVPVRALGGAAPQAGHHGGQGHGGQGAHGSGHGH